MASEFVERVLDLRLQIAIFDCDGTLWSGDAGQDFFYWEIDRGMVRREMAEAMVERYRLYQSGDVSEEAICGEMVTMNRGLEVQQLYAAGEQFYQEVVSSRVFPEMQQLTLRLAEAGCELWAVSSTNHWVVEAGVVGFGFARDHVLAACVHSEDGRATDRLLRVPTDDLKAAAIREVIGRPVDGVFGNSMHDLAMLEMAAYPFCINPNPDLEAIARKRNWPIYWPADRNSHSVEGYRGESL